MRLVKPGPTPSRRPDAHGSWSPDVHRLIRSGRRNRGVPSARAPARVAGTGGCCAPGENRGPAADTDTRTRYAIGFAVHGDLRFLSHRDMLRMFQRALVRAGVPVWYSEGFNPRIRLWLPLPRAVGVAAEAELLIIECAQRLDPARLIEALAVQMPSGLTVSSARALGVRANPRPVAAEYRLDLDASLIDATGRAAAAVWDCETVEVRRSDPGKPDVIVNVRSYLAALRVVGSELHATTHVTQQGTVRPRELMTILGLSPQENCHRLRRIAVTWDWPVGTEETEPPKGVGS